MMTKWIIYYSSIGDFISELPNVDKFLDKAFSEGRITAIVPNTGLQRLVYS